jgi:phosphohistidine phosphatase
MIVTIWRHGEAGRAASDRLRELTDTGTDGVGFGCHQFDDACRARDLPKPELVLHSPWVRTMQTAGILASAFTHAELRVLEALQPGSHVGAVEDALVDINEGQPELRHTVLVSHQPLVSYLIDHLLGEVALVPALPPGGLVTMDLAAPARACGRLLFWALPPQYEADR